MTMGEGGAVYTNNPELHKYVNSYRDWGRECWCVGGVDNTCGYRFSKQFGQLPVGYDHKYVYSHLGFNLKATDMQAAIGCAQLEKLDTIVARRRENFDILYEGLKDVPGIILPTAQPNSKPSWFGFLITIKDDAGFSRTDLTKYLESKKIQTRNLFAGNLLRHPAMEAYTAGKDYRVVGELKKTEAIMNQTFWIGVYPGMTRVKLDFMAQTIREFCTKK
jgi:CDP-6-deoxy-D-xylo-4-hexulose-3-dehydrase